MANKKIPKVQVLIFDRKTFKNRKQVKDWVSKNGFKLRKNKKQPIEKTTNTFLCIQRDCCRFNKRTFTRKSECKGVKGLYGKLK